MIYFGFSQKKSKETDVVLMLLSLFFYAKRESKKIREVNM